MSVETMSPEPLEQEVARLQAENARLAAERDQLRLLFDQAPAMICCLIGPNHVFTYANSLYRQLVGRDDIIGRSVAEALPEVVPQGFIDLLDGVYRTGESFIGNQMPVQLDRRSDGTLDLCYVNFVYQALRDHAGTIIGIQVHAVEVTEMVEARHLVQHSEDRFRSLVRATSQLVWMTDVEGRVDDIPEWRAYTGQTAEQVRGYGWVDALHPEDRERAETAWRTAVAERTPYEVDYRIRRHDGVYEAFVARGTPVLEPDGRVREWIGLCVNVQEQRRMEAELKSSEARFRQLADVMPQQVWTATPDGQLDYVNARVAAYGDQPAEAFLGDRWVAMVHPDDVPAAAAAWSRSLTTGEPYETLFRLRHAASGEYRWHVGRAVAIRDEAGGIRQWYGTNTDIHDHKMAELALQKANESLAAQQEELQAQQEELQMQSEELQAQQDTLAEVNRELRVSEARFRELADAMPQMIFTAGPDGSIDYYNQRWYEYTDTTFDETGGWNWKPIHHPDDLQRTIDTWTRCVETGELYTCEYRLQRASDGEYRWHLGRGIPVRDEAGRVVKWYGTNTDIHDHKLIEMQLQRANEAQAAQQEELQMQTEELQEQQEALRLANEELVRLSTQAQAANKMKSEFLANMSHELRTPLNSIIGYTELVLMLAAEQLDATHLGNLEVVLRNALHLLSLINDVLDLSKIEAGKATVYPEPFDPRTMVEAVLGTAEPLAREKGLRLVAHVAPGLSQVVSDQIKVRQIVLNLVSNAVKFTKEGGVDVHLEPVGADHWAVRVVDTGIGIAPEHQSLVFEEFRQVDASSTRQVGGTGLGLSIARGLARLLGGRLELESTLGVGSVFTLTLPRHHQAGAERRVPIEEDGRAVAQEEAR